MQKTSLPNKRAILQPILDGKQQGWTIAKPFNSTDVETECIFRKTDENKEARVGIPNTYFQDADQRHKIKSLVEDAIRHAKVK